jgi:hypothetical protein
MRLLREAYHDLSVEIQLMEIALEELVDAAVQEVNEAPGDVLAEKLAQAKRALGFARRSRAEGDLIAMNDEPTEIQRYREALQDLLAVVQTEVAEPSEEMVYVVKQVKRLLAEES